MSGLIHAGYIPGFRIGGYESCILLHFVAGPSGFALYPVAMCCWRTRFFHGPQVREKPMRKTILAAAAAFIIGGVTTGALIASAQPAPPPGPSADAPPPGHHRMEWMHHRHGMHGGGPFQPGTLALVHREADRQLTPADVQKIAEAFLLWNGNHTWKVMGTTAQPDGAVAFELATQNGSVIAHFTMNPHTARLTRVD